MQNLRDLQSKNSQIEQQLNIERIKADGSQKQIEFVTKQMEDLKQQLQTAYNDKNLVQTQLLERSTQESSQKTEFQKEILLLQEQNKEIQDKNAQMQRSALEKQSDITTMTIELSNVKTIRNQL